MQYVPHHTIGKMKHYKTQCPPKNPKTKTKHPSPPTISIFKCFNTIALNPLYRPGFKLLDHFLILRLLIKVLQSVFSC